ncbi:MAG: SDR family NAD(P)-dependent oxidoreductase [Alphaproteobacteria bacterium]|jgi:NAD(P)-dependent dehydrogenase (short-subunit alcohol dehydrogenase family)|nr:SDR family NAD(P)-dependent oxidoreductase [Rhodospirillaceae bacterium]MBT6508919.1 SDR family NAD(P)-dependent oxidoreductase [Rhodospirillaceae bacterium]MBT7646854.1 SDR family NAD(P)-dependent oxidoreductase [Rhodospirillaceae bacterium]MDG2481308.1 SDR family NAD(P)-dependent oxidoreductase [Alphaproteobacteria bacterium]
MNETSGSNRLDGRIALVTGASRGIGAAVARRFGAEGAQLVLVARTVGGLEEVDDDVRKAGGKPATLVPLDLADGDAIDRIGAALYERHGKLDVMVGNAAILGTLTPTGHIEPKIWQQAFDINVTSNWRLIRSMDPLLRQSDAGRAIFVTSGITAMNPAYWATYAATKAALEALVECWAGELGKTGVKANLLDPGVLRTAMRARAFPGEDPKTLAEPDSIAEAFVRMALPSWTKNGERVTAQSLI